MSVAAATTTALRASPTPTTDRAGDAPVRRTVVPAHWPLVVVFAGYPLLWMSGLATLALSLLAVPLVAQLLLRRRILVPPGFGLWLLFLAWMLVTASQLEKFSHYVAFASRYTLWIGALAVLLTVLNTPRRALGDDAVLRLILWLWGASVVGGYLGLVLGDTRLWTPAQLVMPSSLAEIDFINNMIAPRFAQVQDFLGYPLRRPSAPFTFTNGWGASMAVLWPAVLAAWPSLRGRARGVVGFLAVASIVPMVLSVNRGLWVTLIGTFTYTAFRLARRQDPRIARRLLAVGTVLVLLVLVTPLGSVVSGRLESDHSNNARFTLYTQAREQVLESPVLGFGSPRSNEDNPGYPPVGTHGTFWFMLFSHGIPGAAIFVGLLGSLALRTSRPRQRHMLWLHGVVVAGLVMMPFYELLPMPMFVIAACAGIVLRDRHEETTGVAT